MDYRKWAIDKLTEVHSYVGKTAMEIMDREGNAGGTGLLPSPSPLAYLNFLLETTAKNLEFLQDQSCRNCEHLPDEICESLSAEGLPDKYREILKCYAQDTVVEYLCRWDNRWITKDPSTQLPCPDWKSKGRST